MARLACCVMAACSSYSQLPGNGFLNSLASPCLLSKSPRALFFLLVALDMLRAQRSRVQETSEETAAGVEKTDIAVAPLAIPMLAGPGAISTAILLQNRAAEPGTDI